MNQDAERDENAVTTMLGESSADTTKTTKIAVNPATGGLVVELI